jgi:hypothetical protein
MKKPTAYHRKILVARASHDNIIKDLLAFAEARLILMHIQCQHEIVHAHRAIHSFEANSPFHDRPRSWNAYARCEDHLISHLGAQS